MKNVIAKFAIDFHSQILYYSTIVAEREREREREKEREEGAVLDHFLIDGTPT